MEKHLWWCLPEAMQDWEGGRDLVVGVRGDELGSAHPAGAVKRPERRVWCAVICRAALRCNQSGRGSSSDSQFPSRSPTDVHSDLSSGSVAALEWTPRRQEVESAQMEVEEVNIQPQAE